MAFDDAVQRDQVSLGVLVTAVPRDVVDEAVAAAGVLEKRSDAKLPAHVTAYLTLALALFAGDDYEEVVQKVTGSLDAWGCWNASWSAPTASAISQARKRLGPDVMPAIAEAVFGPAAGEVSPVASSMALGRTRGAFACGRRLVSIDGCDFDLPDTPANVEEFGYAGSGEKRSVFPKARVVTLTECGTHALLAAEVRPYSVGEKTMATDLYPRLQSDELLVADRGFYSFRGWCTAADTGAALVWRALTTMHLPIVEVLPDGTYLSLLLDASVRRGHRDTALEAARASEELDPERARVVRVVEYTVPDREGGGSGELIALLTTLTDPAEAGAEQIAAIYAARWEHETGNDQLKTHLRGRAAVLRSRLPDLAYQEVWAHLIVHHAINTLVAKASAAADLDPDRISYSKTLRLIRRTATGTAAFPPSDLG